MLHVCIYLDSTVATAGGNGDGGLSGRQTDPEAEAGRRPVCACAHAVQSSHVFALLQSCRASPLQDPRLFSACWRQAISN